MVVYEEVFLFIGDGMGFMVNFYESNEEDLLDCVVFIVIRIDFVIDFDFVFGLLIEQLEDDFYMISWCGEFLVLVNDEYIFYFIVDDGVWFWIDEELVIDQWVL